MCYLYHHYSASNELLYVGISLSAVARLSQHRNSEWYDEIARVQIEKMRTREHAKFIEALEIYHFKPRYNKSQPHFDLFCPRMTQIAVEDARAELWIKAFDPSSDIEDIRAGLVNCSEVERDNIIEMGWRQAKAAKGEEM